MANSKTATGSGPRGYGLQLRCTETSTSIENNTSSISWSLVLTAGSSWYFIDYWAGWTVKINGVIVSEAERGYKPITVYRNSEVTITSGTTTVVHNNDGTKTIAISAETYMPYADAGPGDMSCSDTWTLTTIPRASTMTLPSSFTIGSSGSITVQMASNTFSHTITYSGYGLSGTVANLNAGVSSTSWTPPTSFYAKLPSSTSGTVTLTLTTKSGATTVGTATYNATIVVPTSIKPTAPTVTLAPVNTNAWISSKGIYVGGYSAVKVTSSATAGSGATISSYTISGSISGSGTPYTSGVLSAGSKSITVTATDSRGRTNSTTTSVTFLTYTYPGLTTFTAVRGTYSGGSWTSNVNGNHIRVQAVPSVALSAQGNTASVTVKIGNTSPSATSGNYYYFTSTTATQSYTITGSVSDSVGNNTSRTLTVPTIEVPLNINVDLPGIGAGMIAQNPHKLEISPNWTLVSNGKLARFHTMPDTFETVGGSTTAAGYARIATVVFVDTRQEMPIEFQIKRRDDKSTIHLYFHVTTGYDTTDPTGIGLWYQAEGMYQNQLFEAFTYKTGPSTWDVYVKKAYASSWINIRAIIPEFMAERTNLTFSDALLASPPSGATMAKPVPCLNPTVTATKTGGLGELNTATLHRSGNVVQLRITVHTTSAVAVGATLLSLTTNAPRPVNYVSATDITGTYAAVGWLNTDGTFSSREAIGEVPTNRYYTFSFIYLTND